MVCRLPHGQLGRQQLVERIRQLGELGRCHVFALNVKGADLATSVYTGIRPAGSLHQDGLAKHTLELGP